MIVSIKNLVKRYKGHLVLDHFNMEIENGELYGIAGLSGAGKTTVLHCILGLEKYEKGTIKVFGNDVLFQDDERKRKIGAVFQTPSIFRELKVYDNVYYFCSFYIREKELLRKCTDEAIKLMDLEEYKDMYPDMLSAGLLRRLDIACGIAHKPKLLLVDEFESVLDLQSQTIVLDGMKQLHKNGTTIIYVTNHFEELEKICTSAAIINMGRMAAFGTKEELEKQISTGEKITVRVYNLPDEKMLGIRNISNVFYVNYENGCLTVKLKKGKENLIHFIQYLTEQKICFGEISVELPKMKDVFLEMTSRK